uniref:V-type proton ATPase subunit G n=1 Tax=Rhodosorus marinus TaxID=101924 RepID=A0A7S3EEC8_9RHOD
MSGKSAQTIQQLLEAEKAAAEVVEQARKERDERLKKASLEAEAEIAAYREMLEKEYQEKLAKVGRTRSFGRDERRRFSRRTRFSKTVRTHQNCCDLSSRHLKETCQRW